MERKPKVMVQNKTAAFLFFNVIKSCSLEQTTVKISLFVCTGLKMSVASKFSLKLFPKTRTDIFYGIINAD